MIRRLFTILSALSLALMLAIGALWLRSRTHHDAVLVASRAGSNWMVGSRAEGIRIWRIVPWPIAEPLTLHSYRAGSNPLLLRLSYYSSNHWRWFGIEGVDGTAAVPLNNDTGMPVWARADEKLDREACHNSPTVEYGCITVPHWQVLIAFGFLPALWLVARFDRQWRARRFILMMLAAASLGLCIGISTLWVRSYKSSDEFHFGHEGVLWSAVSSRGNLTIDNAAARAMEKELNEAAYENLRKMNDRDDELSAEIANKLDQHPTLEQKLALEKEDRRLDAEMTALMNKMLDGPQSPSISVESHSIRLAIPAGISSILPIFVLGTICTRRFRRKARSRDSRCLTCGYDLRATPDRCPECGTESKISSQGKPPN